MPGLQIEVQPTSEPVSLTDMKNYLRVTVSNDDTLISSMISGARELVEAFTGRSYVPKGFIQVLDAFPYFADTVLSQNSMPPSYYALPRYSTTLWNYSQMIKLLVSPLIAITDFDYIDVNGDLQTLNADQYIVDSINEPARIFPATGTYWPPVLYVPNAVQIHFTAGMNPNQSIDGVIPFSVGIAIRQLVANWYENREAAAQGSYTELPNHIKSILWANRVLDLAPTRG
jgi:uncharacterized phiE125 gp8 family phage protein